MKRCPHCSVQHFDGVDLCDCGYSFNKGSRLNSHQRHSVSSILRNVLWTALSILVAVFVGALVGQAYKNSKTNTEPAPQSDDTEQRLATISNKLNETLPRMIDKYTRLDTTIPGPGKKWTYLYTFVEKDSSEVSSQQLQDTLHDYAVESSCSTIKPLTKDKITIVHRYRGKYGAVIGDIVISPADCK